MFAMSTRQVKVTLISNRNERAEFSGDERRCCVQAEDVLRQWYWTGCAVSLEITSPDANSRMRVQTYLADVSRELSNEAKVLS